jgi:hypothetical protein
VPVPGVHSGESLQGFDGFFEDEGVKVGGVVGMDGAVKRLEDTNLMEPAWLGLGGEAENRGRSREVGEMRLVRMLVKFPEAGGVVAGLRNKF